MEFRAELKAYWQTYHYTTTTTTITAAAAAVLRKNLLSKYKLCTLTFFG